jgi:hypothetical protein
VGGLAYLGRCLGNLRLARASSLGGVGEQTEIDYANEKRKPFYDS